MHLVVVGVNYNTAPVDIREKLAMDEGELGTALVKLTSNLHISEACIVSTCNRTEIYAVTRTRADDEHLKDFLASYNDVERDTLESCVYCYQGHHAVKHLFEVACGLNSMALGETQVLGQIRNAYCVADESESTGTILNNLFQRAISVGKRARTETAISCGAFSIGAAAVELAKFVLGDLSGRKALLIGAGDMSKLAATHLIANGLEKVYVTSRTLPRVKELVEALGGEGIKFDRLEEALREVDVVISSTSAKHLIITKELAERVMLERGHTPLFFIDIAVPRDIDPDVAHVEGAFVYNIDDLRIFVDRCRTEREAEVEKVQEIIEDEMIGFMSYMHTLEAVPLIKQLRNKFESVYQSEWDRCAPKLAHLPEEDRERVRKSLMSVVKKLTHDPILQMKEYAANGGSHKLEIVRELFGLPPEEPSKNQPD